MSGVGNAFLQLRKHRYRDRAVLITREWISSNRWAVSIRAYDGVCLLLQVARNVSEKSFHNRQRGISLSCLELEEAAFYLRQEMCALSVVAVITEITKRVEMGKISGFVTLFIPVGLFPSAIRPLVYAALDLMTTSKIRQHSGLMARKSDPYHGE